jgi:hypothetical protein
VHGLGPEHLAQHRRDLVGDLEEPRVEVADERPALGLEHPRVHRARAGTEQQTLGRDGGGDGHGRLLRRDGGVRGQTTRCIRSRDPSVIDFVPRASAIVPLRTISRMP